MQVFRGVPSQADASTVLTIGNFDGVHRGHQALLGRVVEHARRLALPAAVLTFEPHPREFFVPESAPPRLSSLREKIEYLREHGVDRLFVARFNRAFASLTAEQFIERTLVRGLAVRHLIIGDDFRFGCGRSGDFAQLRAAGHALRFVVEAMPTVEAEGARASSSAVRTALQAGDVDRAARLLGRRYEVSGKVVRGDQLGRQLGFPTANVHHRRNRLAVTGVFAVEVAGAGDQILHGAANVGMRPTVGGVAAPRVEVHLLDFAGDLYGAHLRVRFAHRLRDEMRFPGLDALKAQIARDVQAARDYFESAARAAN